jgi:hypothetical protein
MGLQLPSGLNRLRASIIDLTQQAISKSISAKFYLEVREGR